MRISGKLVATWGLEKDNRGATIELSGVDIKSVNFGDRVWVEHTVPSNEPTEKWLGRHTVIAHFPQERKDEGIDVPLKFSCVNPHVAEIADKINALIDAVAKLAERVK